MGTTHISHTVKVSDPTLADLRELVKLTEGWPATSRVTVLPVRGDQRDRIPAEITVSNSSP